MSKKSTLTALAVPKQNPGCEGLGFIDGVPELQRTELHEHPG